MLSHPVPTMPIFRLTPYTGAIMHTSRIGSRCLVAAAVVLGPFMPVTVRATGLLPAAQPESVPAAGPASSSAEARAARAYQAAVRQGPLAVQAFLADFPKGADLHFHFTAGVYAETLIRFAAEDKVCIDP